MGRRVRLGIFFLLLALLGAGAVLSNPDAVLDLLERGGGAALGPAAPEEGLAATWKVDLFFVSAEDDLLKRHSAALEDREDRMGNLRAAVEALVAGPPDASLFPAVPPGAKLRTVVIGPSGTVYLDFDKAMREGHPGGAWAEMLTAHAVANTVLLNFPEYERVAILIDGQEAETIAGSYSIAGPLRAREDLIAEDPPPAEGPPSAEGPSPVVGPPPVVGVPAAPIPPVGAPGGGQPRPGGGQPRRGGG